MQLLALILGFASDSCNNLDIVLCITIAYKQMKCIEIKVLSSIYITVLSTHYNQSLSIMRNILPIMNMYR